MFLMASYQADANQNHSELSLTPLRMSAIRKTKDKTLATTWRKETACPLFMGMQISPPYAEQCGDS